MLLAALMMLQLVKHPVPTAQAPTLSRDERRLQDLAEWNSSLFGQLNACEGGPPAFDPYGTDLEADLWVTLRLAPDGRLIGEPEVQTAGRDLVITADLSRPEIEQFFKDCAPYPAALPGSPALLNSDGTRVLHISLPLARQGPDGAD